MTTQFIKPADGLKVRKPNGEFLDAKGETVALDVYWARRLKDGDVVKAPAPKPDAPQPSTKSKG